jgi:hypothetical protein
VAEAALPVSMTDLNDLVRQVLLLLNKGEVRINIKFKPSTLNLKPDFLHGS